MDSFYSQDELKLLGLKSYGENVNISRKASFYGEKNITIGNNVRIDDFCILSGKIEIGDYVHIAAYSALYGGNDGIYIKNFVNISSRICIYSISDDYSGETLTSPLVPIEYKNITSAKVIINKHTIIGSGCTILPNVEIAEGCAFGAMSLINKSTNDFTIYAGIPIRKIKSRKKDLLELEKKFLESEKI